MELPKNYDPHEAEPRWQKYWEENDIYTFDPESDKEIYSIDTPPPTVSGKMHLGHAFSYSQQDFIARFQRMIGKSVFYPFGTDDNGLATERLIEKEKKVKGSKMDRQEFIALCNDTLNNELRPKYVSDWKRIGMSCDWDIFYSTINDHSRKISQKSFIDLYNNDRIYRKKSPMTICPQCQTAIAQVEMEDVPQKSTLNYIKAQLEGTNEFLVYATTRPELLPGCVGMTLKEDGMYVKAKKGDEIWILSKEGFEKFKDEWELEPREEVEGKECVGKNCIIPLTNAKIEVRHDTEAKTEYGSGVVYYCTYGGAECVEFMTRNPDIEPIHIMDISGRYNELAGKYKGMTSIEARKEILIDLEQAGVLIKKETLSHPVNVHERCGTDIEYVATEQWFIKYLDLREQFLEDGSRLNWYPAHMKVRLDNWIKGLKWDWCISRQRFFGVPFPVWYCSECNEPAVAEEKDLPVDPLKDPCPVQKCEKCGCTEFIPEKDVLDTWATSSMTPQLAVELFKDHPVYEKLFPMSLRPQAHDIITFWLFNTMVKSQLHHNKNPWENVVISGHAQDPHGRKMSKSKGNVVEPQEVISKYSSDALRFWAAGSKLGDDLPYQEKDIVTGKKMTTKLWNASKFAIMHLEDYDHKTSFDSASLQAMDRWLLSKLHRLIKDSTLDFERYEYSKTKLGTEMFFWQLLCDNYLEIVKDRLYNPDVRGKENRIAAQCTLYHTILSVLKIMSPIMPHITEEVYHLYFNQKEGAKSIHISGWPHCDESLISEEVELFGDFILQAIAEVRKKKSEAQKSLKDPIKKLTLKGDFNTALFDSAKDDIQAVTKSESVEFEKSKEESIQIEL